MYLTFAHPTAATGHQLSDQLLLRVDPQTQRPVGLTIFNISVHLEGAQQLPSKARTKAYTINWTTHAPTRLGKVCEAR
jgi:hypothetical protein